ncbi:MAG: ABC transporter permease [Alphaproteobacteria bacterium]
MTTAAAAGAPRRRRFFAIDQYTAYWAMVAPAALLMAAFYFYPLVQVLWISVTEPKPGLDNYVQLFTNLSIRRTLITTARICVITTAVTVVLGYVVAYVLVHASPRVQRWLFLGVLVPLWISVLVRAFAWVTLLAREGLINTTLRDAGLIDQPLALIWNEFGIVVGMVHYMIPYAVLPLYAGMRDIDMRTVAAARGLGASRLYAFRRVFLPQSLPGIIGATVLVFIFSLGFFVTPAILGGGKTLMVAEYISLQILDLLRWGLGTMLATSLVIFIFLLLAALARVVDLKRLFGAG